MRSELSVSVCRWQCVRTVSTAKAADSGVRVPIMPRVMERRALVAVLPAGLEPTVINVSSRPPPRPPHGSAVFLPVYYFHVFWRRTFFLSPNRQCQSTEGLSKLR